MDSTPPLTSMADDDQKLHIVMFPWLAFGHMMPFLELAKLIAQKGHRISYVSTPRNIDRLPKLPPNLASSINFVKLPLTHVENLPENAEATIDVPYDKVQYLKKAYDGLQEPLTKFLETSNPDWVIHDFAPYWLAAIATRLGLSCAFFSIFLATFLCVMEPTSDSMDVQDDRTEPEHFTVPPKWIPFPSNLAFRYFEVARVFDIVEVNDSGVSDMYRLKETIRGCDVFAVRGCSEFEPGMSSLLEKLHQTPVVSLGQLPNTAYDSGNDKEDELAWQPIKQWLDAQKKGSVVYLAFGSEVKLSQDELTEIALGLELSEAPQSKILSHDSVGGFLTHSGWSSVVEAIQFGRALILLPFVTDQGFNARILEEKKMGYPIPRNERDGSFTRNSVADSLRLVMVTEDGEIYRKKVKEMKGVFGDKDRQDRYINNFLGFLQAHKKHLHT